MGEQIAMQNWTLTLCLCAVLGCGCNLATTAIAGRSSGPLKPPAISSQSTRKQIDAFVKYFRGKGFAEKQFHVEYQPNGKVKQFRYQASRDEGDVHESVDATIDPAKRTSKVTLHQQSGGT